MYLRLYDRGFAIMVLLLSLENVGLLCHKDSDRILGESRCLNETRTVGRRFETWGIHVEYGATLAIEQQLTERGTAVKYQTTIMQHRHMLQS